MSASRADWDDPIEAYLDQLLVALPGSPRDVRHTLAEVEAHLRESAAQAVVENVNRDWPHFARLIWPHPFGS